MPSDVYAKMYMPNYKESIRWRNFCRSRHAPARPFPPDTKVRTDEYASESEVIRDGLRSLMARDRAVESWLRDQVAPAYDALKADPSRVVTTDEVRARLAAEHTKTR